MKNGTSVKCDATLLLTDTAVQGIKEQKDSIVQILKT